MKSRGSEEVFLSLLSTTIRYHST